MSERIEFYKNRSIGERFSVAIDFLKQNWKVLYKNILIAGLPLALIMAFLLKGQISANLSMRTGESPFTSGFFFFYLLFYLVSFINMIYMYSMTGAVLHQYNRNQLTESTGWSDLSGTFFRFAGKTVLISLIVYIPVVIIVAIIAALFGMFAGIGGGNAGLIVLMILLIILLIGGFIAFAPSLTMLYFPAYFSQKSILESIKTSFALGFKNWGSLFVAIILVGMVFTIIYVLFVIPFALVSALMHGTSIITLTFAALLAIAILLIYPIMFIIFAFQYFSVVEKEEGVSLQSQINEFENL
jgi:hypothetical protein